MKTRGAQNDQMSPRFRPDKDVRYAISDSVEMARGGGTYQAGIYPYIAVNCHGGHWVTQSATHDRALEIFKTTSKSSRGETGHQCSLQAWLLYSERVIFASGIVGGISEFGGLHTQFRILAATLNLATVENTALAPEYNENPHLHPRRDTGESQRYRLYEYVKRGAINDARNGEARQNTRYSRKVARQIADPDRAIRRKREIYMGKGLNIRPQEEQRERAVKLSQLIRAEQGLRMLAEQQQWKMDRQAQRLHPRGHESGGSRAERRVKIA